MLEKAAKDISRHLVRQGALDAGDWEVCAYGLECHLGDIFQIAVLAVLAPPCGLFWQAACFVLAFAALKVWLGGFHLNGHLSCLVVSTAMVLLATYGATLLPLSAYMAVTVSSICLMLALTYWRAPVTHPNNPKNTADIHYCRLRARRTALLEAAIIPALLLSLPQTYGIYVVCGAFGAVLAALSMLLPIPKQKGGYSDEEHL